MSDREKVIKGLEQFRADFKPFCGNGSDWARVDDALVLLKEQPEIVRCKDCKYNNGKCNGLYLQLITCYKTGSPHREDWFCADGERR